MTITVSLEELRSYQEAMEKYYNDALQRAGTVTVEMPPEAIRFREDVTMKLAIQQKVLDSFRAENPMPKLIPDDL